MRRQRRLSLGVEVALAFGVAVASFALAAVTVAAVGPGGWPGVLGAVYGVAVLAMFRYAGVAYAIPAAFAVLVAYDWYVVPPTHSHAFPRAADLAYLVSYLLGGVLVGELASHAGRRAEALEVARSELVGEQAALRRVATLVARGAPPPEVFAAVAQEVGQLLGVDATFIGRYGSDDTSTGVGSWSRAGPPVPLGMKARLDGTSVTALVFKTGRPARRESTDSAWGEIATITRELGIQSAVGAPIVVEGRPWGVMIAASNDVEPLPPDTETRIAAFTELVATAISNTEARVEVSRLAEEQAALRRVATLVAREYSATQVFAEVAREMGLVLDAEGAWIYSYESDNSATAVAAWGAGEAGLGVGTRLDLDGDSVVALVRRTGRPARIDDYANAAGSTGVIARALGLRSAVGSPVIVGGRLWGAITAVTVRSQSFPADAESRIEEFTELVATAISNIQARSDLAASRARIVAAADEERRRVVRDLHDGAQQRLVHTVVTLKLARSALKDDPADAPPLVDEALQHAERATAELRELAHGILPSVLTRGGLRAGVVALASRMPVPVHNGVLVDRLPLAVEATAYFVVAEALTNVAKHSHAEHVAVTAFVEEGILRVQVRDDGIGGARPDGSGLIGLGDRLAVLDGSLHVESAPDDGTLITAAIPCR